MAKRKMAKGTVRVQLTAKQVKVLQAVIKIASKSLKAEDLRQAGIVSLKLKAK